MGRFLKPGKVVLVVAGRFAGRKAVIVKNFDEPSGTDSFGHALLAGIDKYPLPITRSMYKKKQERRSRIRPFLKVINYTHLMPTRYSVDISFDSKKVNKEILGDPSKKRQAKREIQSKFQQRYKAGKSKWFFQKLRF
eukprot:TRINITY_DN48631_c0_g1_i1.p1 TRINITY_DN48631_c0_g1~~TRINITY_DN48631_c0_g1_i1.p1  ORF type:complete len:137 (+),score=5.51 TRINITY_DN48631_c0_g1_i1:19-429(+)